MPTTEGAPTTMDYTVITTDDRRAVLTAAVRQVELDHFKLASGLHLEPFANLPDDNEGKAAAIAAGEEGQQTLAAQHATLVAELAKLPEDEQP